jgi:pyrroloquinoline quinone biosynthesis protein D
MDTITDAHIPSIAPLFRFQWEEVQNCHVILYPEGMVKLSASAGEILKRCDGVHSVGAIISELEQQFPGAQLGPDVRKFLEDARDHGWIRTR